MLKQFNVYHWLRAKDPPRHVWSGMTESAPHAVRAASVALSLHPNALIARADDADPYKAASGAPQAPA